MPLLIYIAGPYRAADPWRVNLNVNRAECVATMVWEAGHLSLCPHANTRYASSRVTDAQYLAGTMEMMRRCDAVLVLPKHAESEGTLGEIADAEARGIPVMRLAKISRMEVEIALAAVLGRLAA